MFLEGLIHQLEAFAMRQGVRRDDINVRLTFADGSSVYAQGLRIQTPFADGQWGLIMGVAGVGAEALAVRDEDVRRADFQVKRQASPIGFAAERS